MNQAMEITDRFNEENVCYIQLQNGEETLYVTIKYNDGYSISPYAFIQP